MPGQLVGAPVEFAVAQLLLAGLHRSGLGAAPYLGLEQPVQGLLQGVIHGRGVEPLQQVLTLLRRQDRHLAQGPLRRRLQVLHQGQQGLLHVAADTLGTDPRQGHGGETEPLAQVVDVEAQGVVGALLAVQGLDALPGLLHGLARHPVAAVAVVEHGTEQRQRRGHPAATLGQGQGGVFMTQQGTEPGVGVLDRGTAATRIQVDPQRQGVDEHAQGPVGALPGAQAPQQHGAEHHPVLARGDAQDPGPGQVEQARRTHPQQPGLGPQARTQ